jgi:hypothetical protein
MPYKSPYIGPKAQSGAAVSNPHTNLRGGGLGYDALQDPHMVGYLRTPRQFKHLLAVSPLPLSPLLVSRPTPRVWFIMLQ